MESALQLMGQKNKGMLRTLTLAHCGNPINPHTCNEGAPHEKNMKEAGKNLSVNRYEAGHGFANPSNPSFNAAATEDAYAKAIAFFKAH